MKTKLIALLMVTGGLLAAAPRVAIGVHIGRPAPVVVHSYRPVMPGPGYVWVDGYYDEYGYWMEGYWALPPYAGAYWVAPRHNSGRWIAGYWNGPRGIHRHVAPAPMLRHAPPRHAAPHRAPEVRRYERGYRR